MPFLSLSLGNFRNLKDGAIDVSNKEIFFVGKNGQGKSNLLESLYFAAYGSSFRTRVDAQVAKNGAGNFFVSAFYSPPGGNAQKINVSFENGKKRIEKNGKRIHDRKELINTIPCVLFCHDDMQFATGAPEFRRFFLDQTIAMLNPLYIDDLRDYKKILKNRNAALKEKSYETLDAYDIQLAGAGLVLQKKRRDIVFQFNQIFGKLYEDVSGIDGVSLRYVPSWKEIPDEVGTKFPDARDVAESLARKREQDKILGTTMTGPHRDRLVFTREGRQFIPVASMGQRRLAALLLRVAQSVCYTRATGNKPALLMDDVMLELDTDKRRKFTELLPEYDQLFCTFLPGEPYEKYRRDTTKVYQIENGEWT